MNIAILIYPGFTSLDVVGPYEILHRLPGAQTTFVALEPGPVPNDSGHLSVVAEASIDDVPSPDLLLVGGGMAGTRRAMQEPRILDWIRKAHETTRYTVSVCTGSLILGAAGLLQDKTATSHWGAAEELAKVGATYTDQRYIQEGKIITAAGVSAGIDMALYLASEIAGEGVAQALQLATEYDPQPPFNSGSVKKASPEILALVTQGLAAEG